MEENPILYHLGEALRLSRLENATSAVGLHIVNALATFGTKGQDKVRAADAARRNRANSASTLNTQPASNAREWKPAVATGKPSALPAKETVELPMQSKAQPQSTKSAEPESPQPVKSPAQVAEIKAEDMPKITKSLSDAMNTVSGSAFQRIETYKNAGEITRPTKALELFGIEQIRAYLKLKGKAVSDTASERQAGAALIAHFQEKGA